MEQEFVWPVRVYYEDTDAGGVVYYANYLRFIERARTEWLRSLGYEQDELIARDNVLFAVRSVQADYLQPARFNQQLTIKSTITEVGRASLVFKQSILNPQDTIVFTALVKVACLKAESLRPTAIPKPMMEHIQGVLL